MTTAFVLSGGGSLGSVQAGMLEVLLAEGIRPDFVVGTSVGALNGAWLAGDPTVEGMRALGELWTGLRRADAFPTSPFKGFSGFLGLGDHVASGRGIRRLLRRNLRFDRLEDAPIPLHVVATDVLSGMDVCLSTGRAEDAISGSAAIPGLLPPVSIGDRVVMDGGAANNTPISHAVALGATTVWVMTTGQACALTEPPRNSLGMAMHGLSIVINQRVALDVERFEQEVDLRLVPPLCPMAVNPADFSHAAEIIDRAREQTRDWLHGSPPSHGQAAALAPHRH